MISQALVVALAGTAAATYSPHQLNGVRNLQAGDIAARQGPIEGHNSSTECRESVFSIMNDIPTPTSDLVNYLQTFIATAHPTDPAALCAVTSSLPTSIASAYSSYDQAASSWYSEHSSEIAQLASSCGRDGSAQFLTEAITALESYTAAGCTGSPPTAVANITSLIPTSLATATGASNATISQTGSSSSQTLSTSQAAAAKPTGMVAGVMAAAGFIGAVAMI